MKSNLSNFSFMDCATSVVCKKSLPNRRSRSLPSMFSFSFILGFTLRYMIHLMLIFMGCEVLAEARNDDDIGAQIDKLILKCMWEGKGNWLATITLKNNKVRELTLAGYDLL